MQTKDFYWDINVNLTHYKNKVSYLPDERKTMTTPEGVQGYSSGVHFFGEGIPLYTFYMQKYAGVNELGEALYYKDVKDDKGNVTGRETTTNYSVSDSIPLWFFPARCIRWIWYIVKLERF